MFIPPKVFVLFLLFLENKGGPWQVEAKAAEMPLGAQKISVVGKESFTNRKKYVVIAAPGMEDMAQKIQNHFAF